jgi:molybdopterin synthase sulfur carrier subunit
MPEAMTSQGPEMNTTVRVRLFAGLRERIGWGERLVPLGEAATPTPLELWERLGLADGTAGADGALPPGLRVAVNQAFAPADTPLQPGDEVAFLPPISGG